MSPLHSRGFPKQRGTKSEVKTYARGHHDAPRGPWYLKVWVSSTARRPNSCTARALRLRRPQWPWEPASGASHNPRHTNQPPAPPGLARGGRSPGGLAKGLLGRGGGGGRLLLLGLLRSSRAGVDQCIPLHLTQGYGGGLRASYVPLVLKAMHRVWSPCAEKPPAGRPRGLHLGVCRLLVRLCLLGGLELLQRAILPPMALHAAIEAGPGRTCLGGLRHLPGSVLGSARGQPKFCGPAQLLLRTARSRAWVPPSSARSHVSQPIDVATRNAASCWPPAAAPLVRAAGSTGPGAVTHGPQAQVF